MTSLKEKAIDIKGKKYVLVSDRVKYFNECFPEGSITTEMVSPYDSNLIVIKATILPDYTTPERKFTGYSQAIIGEGYINKTSALENAETSAVGRALGLMGIGVIDSIASVDEINKAETYPKKSAKKFDTVENQKVTIMSLLNNLGLLSTLPNKAEIESAVVMKTDLPLEEVNYKEIIVRLKALVNPVE